MTLNELRQALQEPLADLYEIDTDSHYLLILPPSTGNRQLGAVSDVLRGNDMRHVVVATGDIKIFNLKK